MNGWDLSVHAPFAVFAWVFNALVRPMIGRRF